MIGLSIVYWFKKSMSKVVDYKLVKNIVVHA